MLKNNIIADFTCLSGFTLWLSTKNYFDDADNCKWNFLQTFGKSVHSLLVDFAAERLFYVQKEFMTRDFCVKEFLQRGCSGFLFCESSAEKVFSGCGCNMRYNFSR